MKLAILIPGIMLFMSGMMLTGCYYPYYEDEPEYQHRGHHDEGYGDRGHRDEDYRRDRHYDDRGR